MTDEPGADRDAQQRAQEQVRRLLAAARHDEPAPPDVVARLDAALAAEADRRPGAASPAPATTSGPTVVDLAARRRRRRRSGLLAAAVVVVAGVGIGAVGLDGGLGDGLGGGGAEDSGVGGSAVEAESPAPGSDDAPGAAPQRERPDAMGAPAPLPRVRTGASLAGDVGRALRTAEPLPADRARCAPATDGDEVVPVLADGSRAELLAGPVSRGSREVSLHACGTADDDGALATVVVPAG